MNDDMERIGDLSIEEWQAPDLHKQVQQIATELFEVCKLVGYQARYDEEAVMGHYMCSFLAANSAIALCMKLCEKENLVRLTFWQWLRKKPPAPLPSK
jgi:hypothetical protein